MCYAFIFRLCNCKAVVFIFLFNTQSENMAQHDSYSSCYDCKLKLGLDRNDKKERSWETTSLPPRLRERGQQWPFMCGPHAIGNEKSGSKSFHTNHRSVSPGFCLINSVQREVDRPDPSHSLRARRRNYVPVHALGIFLGRIQNV